MVEDFVTGPALAALLAGQGVLVDDNGARRVYGLRLIPGSAPRSEKEPLDLRVARHYEVEHLVPGKPPLLTFTLAQPNVADLVWLAFGRMGTRAGDLEVARAEDVRRFVETGLEASKPRPMRVYGQVAGLVEQAPVCVELYRAELVALEVANAGGVQATLACLPDFTEKVFSPELPHSGRIMTFTGGARP